jgi:hypothetical protein
VQFRRQLLDQFLQRLHRSLPHATFTPSHCPYFTIIEIRYELREAKTISRQGAKIAKEIYLIGDFILFSLPLMLL